MKTIQLPQARRYSSLGHCIYCGTTSAQLGDEHIIPYALNGELVFTEASCGRCATIINREIEGPFLQEMVVDVRAHLDMRSRSKKRKNGVPPSLRKGKIFRFSERSSGEWEYLEREARPFCFAAAVLEPPTLLLNQMPKAGITQYGVQIYFNPDFHEKRAKIRGRWGLVQSFIPDVFCRQMAKIAHGAALAELGEGSFRATLPSVILGEDRNVFHYVGGTVVPSGEKIEQTHSISITEIGGWLAVNVRLFSGLGAPGYLAIVGKMA